MSCNLVEISETKYLPNQRMRDDDPGRDSQGRVREDRAVAVTGSRGDLLMAAMLSVAGERSNRQC